MNDQNNQNPQVDSTGMPNMTGMPNTAPQTPTAVQGVDQPVTEVNETSTQPMNPTTQVSPTAPVETVSPSVPTVTSAAPSDMPVEQGVNPTGEEPNQGGQQ